MSSHKALTGKHNYAEFKEETVQGRVKKMVDYRDGLDITDLHIKLSYGNRKTGSLVPSISLIPIADCGHCAHCAKGCYAIRNIACYDASRKMMAQNSAIARKDRGRFFVELDGAMKFLRFFRYFVAGDILDYDFFDRMVQLAIRNPQCQQLAFTKMHSIVNRWIEVHGPLPENLHIIFSEWRGLVADNPYNLRETEAAVARRGD